MFQYHVGNSLQMSSILIKGQVDVGSVDFEMVSDFVLETVGELYQCLSLAVLALQA